MLTDVIRFEWRYHTRQVSFIAAALFFAGFGFALTATGFGPANVHINSPYDIAQTLGLISLAAVFAIAIFCANSVVRDREHHFEEIVFCTSVEKFPYLFGRFAGSFLAAFTVFSATAIGMMLAALLPLHDASRVGPFSIDPVPLDAARARAAGHARRGRDALRHRNVDAERAGQRRRRGGDLRLLLRRGRVHEFAADGRLGAGREQCRRRLAARSVRPLGVLRTDALLDAGAPQHAADRADRKLSDQSDHLARVRGDRLARRLQAILVSRAGEGRRSWQ